MNIEIDFDYENFGTVLLDATRIGFLGVQRDHSSENFYMFGLSSPAEHGYVNVRASTEEALTDLAKEYYGNKKSREKFLCSFHFR